MTVLIGYALIALIVAGVLFYAAVALLPAGLSMKSESDRRPFDLPSDRLIEHADLERVRIPVALRGYRFAETDDLIDRLTAEITVRDEEIARLRAAPPASGAESLLSPGEASYSADGSRYSTEPDDAFASPFSTETQLETQLETWTEPPVEPPAATRSEGETDY